MRMFKFTLKPKNIFQMGSKGIELGCNNVKSVIVLFSLMLLHYKLPLINMKGRWMVKGALYHFKFQTGTISLIKTRTEHTFHLFLENTSYLGTRNSILMNKTTNSIPSTILLSVPSLRIQFWTLTRPAYFDNRISRGARGRLCFIARSRSREVLLFLKQQL